MCSVRTGLSKFQRSITFLKNNLELSEKWVFDLEKIPKFEKYFFAIGWGVLCPNLITILFFYWVMPSSAENKRKEKNEQI